MLPSVGDSGLDPTPLPPRVRVRVRSIGGRFLAVLPGDSSHPARLCLTFAAPDPHRADHSLQAFALEALPDSDRYFLRSLAYNRHVVLLEDGAALGMAAAGQPGCPLDVDFDSDGRVTLRFCEAKEWLLETSAAGGCRLTAAGGHERHGSKWSQFELVRECAGEGRRSCLKLPVCLYLKTPRGCYLCAAEPTLKEGPKVPCCCEQLLLDIPCAPAHLAAESSGPVCRLWTGDCQGVIMREMDGSLAAVRPDESYGRDALSLRVRPGNRLSLKWEAPRPVGSSAPRHHTPVAAQPLRRCAFRWVSLACQPPRAQPGLPRPTRPLGGGLSKADTACCEEGPSKPGAGKGDAPMEAPPPAPAPAPLPLPHPSCARQWGNLSPGQQGSLQRGGRRSRSFHRGLCQLDAPAPPLLPQPGRVPPELCGLKASLHATAELVPRREVLLLTEHGQFLAAAAEPGSPTAGSEAVLAATWPNAPLTAAWELAFHGDNVYSICSAADRATGDPPRCLQVDEHGGTWLSTAAVACFPAPDCLFEVQLMAGGRGLRDSVGFTIRTLHPIQGAKRFLSAEPNGRLTASRLRAGAWELFSLADIRAIASCRLPQAWAALLTTKSKSASDQAMAKSVWHMATAVQSQLAAGAEQPAAPAAEMAPYACPPRTGWGSRSAASLGSVCSRMLVHVLEHNNSPEGLAARLRQCALPEDVAARLVEQWGARLGAHGTSCKTILPRELTTAAFNQQHPDRRLSLCDFYYECRHCAAQHLLMDPRVNSAHHWHLEALRRGAHAAQRPPPQPAVGSYLTLATVSIFVGTILGKLVAPGSDRMHPMEMSGAPHRSHRDGEQPGLLRRLLRDPWMWTHLFVMNVIGRAVAGN